MHFELKSRKHDGEKVDGFDNYKCIITISPFPFKDAALSNSTPGAPIAAPILGLDHRGGYPEKVISEGAEIFQLSAEIITALRKVLLREVRWRDTDHHTQGPIPDCDFRKNFQDLDLEYTPRVGFLRKKNGSLVIEMSRVDLLLWLEATKPKSEDKETSQRVHNRPALFSMAPAPLDIQPLLSLEYKKGG
ncbi:MAG: hypothetical protein WCJ84_06150 [Candidatus Peregrinibacteria bacterium]